MKLIDTHAHLHDPVFPIDSEAALRRARSVGVEKLIMIGTNAEQSAAAVAFAEGHDKVWASVGLHPHEAQKSEDISQIKKLAEADKVVAIGECGLDYYYLNAPKTHQREAFRKQLAVARALSLPVSLHIRGEDDKPDNVYRDIWSIWDEFDGLSGVVHSFSAGLKQMDEALERGLYIALNGIMTFSTDPEHIMVMRDVPMERLLLETDSPYLTPVPYRGKVNEPKYVELTAAHIAEVKGVTKQTLASKTSANAETLFSI